MNTTIKIEIIERRLSDGSMVYDVICGQLYLPAISERDAFSLADALGRALETHINLTVKYY